MNDDQDDDIVLTPLCTVCVADLPAEGEDVCAFCSVIEAGMR